MRQRKAKDLEKRLRECSAYMIADPGSGSRDYFSGHGVPSTSDTFARDLFVEIGCGKGQFIINKALADPDSDFIAIEGQETVLLRALEKAAACEAGHGAAGRTEGARSAAPADSASRAETVGRADPANCAADCGIAGCLDPGAPAETASRAEATERAAGLSNLRFMLTFVHSMEDLFDRGQVSGIYLNFSDPWPKARHAKRRLTHRDRLRDYARVLAPGGFIEVKTDNDDLYDFTLEELEAAGYRIEEQTRDLHASGFASRLITTEYEDKFSSRGKNINYVRAVPT